MRRFTRWNFCGITFMRRASTGSAIPRFVVISVCCGPASAMRGAAAGVPSSGYVTIMHDDTGEGDCGFEDEFR
ncbi:hypothetical protein KCP73_07440 [Salmonella enterica subsp. enterica]|nr:hypothetical protein KCP73_07440 [Salmonella enterica subsp. enterica]